MNPHPLTGQPFESPVPPGTGWPDDPATAGTRVARSAAGVARLARFTTDLTALDARVSVCRACPRLVGWREQFTGDRSGDWLWSAFHRAGLATRAVSQAAGDGTEPINLRMGAAVRCAPPANKPTTAEKATCLPWIARELELMPRVRVLLALGGIAWDTALRVVRGAGWRVPRPKPRFAHGAEAGLARPGGEAVTLLAGYHPSQQNTFTGRLTQAMLDDVLTRAKELAGL